MLRDWTLNKTQADFSAVYKIERLYSRLVETGEALEQVMPYVTNLVAFFFSNYNTILSFCPCILTQLLDILWLTIKYIFHCYENVMADSRANLAKPQLGFSCSFIWMLC